MRPLCSTADFVSGECCFVVDLRTVTVDNVLDASFIITELQWVTDIHWHGFNPETEHVPSTVKGMNWEKQKVLTDYRWRDENEQFSCSFWSLGFAFNCLHFSTNVCWLLLLVSHNFITLAYWKVGVRASVVTANGHCFISTLTYCDKQKHILSEKQKHIYALCARLLCLQSILSKDSKMNDLQGVPWC